MLNKIVLCLALGSGLAVQGQTTSAAVPAPTPFHPIYYRHWPEQFVQWVGTELPYSMIELYVDAGAGAKPLYDAVLTERATGKRIHYSDQKFMVDLNKSLGYEAYLTKLQLDRPANPGAEATYTVRFSDSTGAPVIWQFVQGSEVSERGGGLSPAGVQPPVLMYREKSAVAGPGTALKIGNVVSAAEVWKEIAQPPYFVPYHGALTENLEIVVFGDAGDQWTTVEAPQTVAVGAAWKLKAADGHGCTLKVTALQGEVATISEEDERGYGRAVTVEARYANGAWSTKKVHFGPSATTAKGITVTYNPPVSASAEQVKFEVLSGSKTRIASGTVQVDSKQERAGWQFKDPDWLKGKPAAAQSASAATGSPDKTR